MEWLFPISVALFFAVLWFAIIYPIWRNQRNLTYNQRQFAIYERASELIMRKAIENDTPAAEHVEIVNAARQVYNESLRGKHAEEMKLPMIGVRNHGQGSEVTTKGQEPQGEE